MVFTVALKENSIHLHDANQILKLLTAEFTKKNRQIHSFKLSKELEGISIIASDVAKEQNTSVWLVSQIVDGTEGYEVQGSTCTCEGCANGCSPKRKKNGDCYCTDCETPIIKMCKKNGNSWGARTIRFRKLILLEGNIENVSLYSILTYSYSTLFNNSLINSSAANLAFNLKYVLSVLSPTS